MAMTVLMFGECVWFVKVLQKSCSGQEFREVLLQQLLPLAVCKKELI